MKKLITPFALLLLFLATGCSKDSNAAAINSIQGRWKLVNVNGTFAGINNNFTPGTIIWDFNPITQTVTVVNNNPDPNKWDVLETGVYNYQLVNNPEMPCNESLEINGSSYGCFSISNDSLIIDQSVADGFFITLKQ